MARTEPTGRRETPAGRDPGTIFIAVSSRRSHPAPMSTDQPSDWPPSTVRVCPVIHDA